MNNGPSPPQGPLLRSDANHTSIMSTKTIVYKGVITLIDTSVVGTMNTAAGTITVSTVTTASGSSDSVVVNNDFCTESSVIIGTINSYGGTIGVDGFPSLVITPGNNVFTVTIVNESVTAAALSGELTINFIIV